MIMSILSIILLATLLPVARAAPWQTLYLRQSDRGNRDNPSTGLSPAIWIPVVAVGALFLFGGVFMLRKKMQGHLEGQTAASGNGVSTGTNATTTGQARELTAADLTGATPPTTTTTTTTTTTRRQRRPRRTPSQVSTKSLPAYMKEPGDHEVVIYRGLEDMDEEADGEHQSANNSMITTPDTTFNTDGTERTSPDVTRALLPPRTDSPESRRHSANLSRSSYDHHGSDESQTRLIDVRRGEAPAYETIDLDLAEGPTPAPRRQNSQSGRISGFLSRFMSHRGNNDTNEPITLSPPLNVQNSTIPPSHSREPSVQSGGTASADLHGSPGGPRLGRTHRDRVNNSSTGSVFTVLSKTLSRNHDDIPLTSPSLISLNSISPPLTHTATRTEFTYPRTGPTSEQVKFLASKETFGRFGLPYGPDAIAFAASSSRQDLPPDFDSIHQPSFRDLSPNHDEGSASSLRSTSARRLSTGDRSDRGGSPFPESAEPSPDLTSLTEPPSQLSLSKQKSSPNLGIDVLASPSQSSLSKQKSTPNIGAGHPPLSKSASKSKLITSLQSDGDRSFPSRSVSAAGSYLTVESFRTALDDGDGDDSRPSSPTSTIGLVPEITVQLPSNNPSSTNLAEDASGSETEEFFDGDEGTEGGGSGDEEEVEGVNGGGNKTPRAASMNEGHHSHAEGREQENVTDGSSDLSDEDDTDSPAPKSDPNGTRDTRIRTPTSPSSSSDLESGSDDESETETHSNHTEVDKNLVTVDLETDRIPHTREGTDVTLTPELVAATLGASSPDLTKANEGMSRTTTIGA